MSDFYVTTRCNFAHRLADGKPIDHECEILPPAALEAERKGDFAEAIRLIEEAKKPVRFGPLMGQRMLPTSKGVKA